MSASTDAAWKERQWLARLVRGGYLVLDEAQQVKNAESARYRNLSEIDCARRLLLAPPVRARTIRRHRKRREFQHFARAPFEAAVNGANISSLTSTCAPVC